jgi:hypothetical protein
MMAVNDAPIKIALILLLLIGSAHADSGIDNSSQAIIEYAKREVMVKTSDLGERIIICDQRRNSAAIPNLSYGELEKTGLTRHQVIKSLAHLSSRNYNMCEKGTREALAYALVTLSMVAEQYKVDIESIEGIEENLIYPSIRDIELAMEFSNLNDEAKKLLLSVVGDQPFDLIGTLEKNNLAAE